MCFRFNFKVDEKIIAYIAILISADYIIAYIAGVRDNLPLPMQVVNLIVNGLFVVTSFILLIGIVRGRSGYLIPYLVVVVIHLAQLIIIFILNMIAGSFILLVVFGLNSAFWCYCGLCIVSLYQKLKAETNTAITARLPTIDV